MQARELIQEATTVDDLQPGETRELVIQQINKLKELQDRIYKLGGYKMNVAFQEPDPEHEGVTRKFQELLQSIDNKIAKLQSQLNVQQTQNTEINDLLAEIGNRCSQFIAAAQNGGNWLYRGIRGHPLHFIGRSRLDRFPRDSSKLGQLMLDEILQSAGIQALRRNSIFCTSTYSQAKSYAENSLHEDGRVYMIFPVNGFHFLYTNRSDLIVDDFFWSPFWVTRIVQDWCDALREWLANHPDLAQHMPATLGKFPERHSTHTDTQNILYLADEYLHNPNAFVDLPDHLQPSVSNVLEMINQNAVLQDLAPRTDHLENYFKDSYGEICISGTYYALDRDIFETVANQKWMQPE